MGSMPSVGEVVLLPGGLDPVGSLEGGNACRRDTGTIRAHWKNPTCWGVSEVGSWVAAVEPAGEITTR
eukprot:CAMPEP_0194391832 /NCGR_PEP_ID=MMETSP0174-20130528/117988_1 /TAXON_ID=216777 /ORGANISM="Proboscia alata, Strain PI-D3" /LENGTH=67 /DNA_ID=CAMNT_0039186581 /DNA_START=178 /DNA_END=377 /DNA_ORIENTATION=+